MSEKDFSILHFKKISNLNREGLMIQTKMENEVN